MRAVLIPAAGGPEVLAVGDRPVREPGPGEVRIAVRAAAVHPGDSQCRTEGFEAVGLTVGFPGLVPPWTPGYDAADTIDAVGEGVDRVGVGDVVMAVVSPFRSEGGGQAGSVVVPEAWVVPIPDGATLPQAATLPMTGLTALLGLEELGLEPGDRERCGRSACRPPTQAGSRAGSAHRGTSSDGP